MKLRDVPAYAILSHTWGRDDEEVTFKDLQEKPEKAKLEAGYHKIEFCGRQATSNGLGYFWVGTRCIDKSNYAELVEAIISIFRWATRGWILQKLIAADSVEFFSSDGGRRSLEQQLVNITGIAPTVLRGGTPRLFQRRGTNGMGRKTDKKEEEDKTYSRIGIFNIFISLIYYEGVEHALYRLNQKIETDGGISSSQCPPAVEALKSTVDCRKLIQDKVKNRLN
ncbi:hypothetical protein B0T26DRAFT_302778 [Lasiosphaeria miniovina]|uniref:Heterokaryon incompatibility domain-containing protein n=1 Tax=Lasiosphaeria miniovina TaxID=1954250 RepID=A0AA40AL08_9PEZI|nr:uncharacterized protein B0T26DRAFT_302778 [Lasiosphaeria miniovina]KAK0717720.1 hypothetical protein B0T26DRAFT_302778 [Lasiosphaeria miniovina]